jgi:lysophospholipase L1-like esterase
MTAMTGFRVGQLLAAGSLVAMVTACASSGSGTASSPTPRAAKPDASSSSPTPATTKPVGIIAIGHSGLTAENSDPSNPGKPALQNSWVTGTTPAVNSIYLRLVAAHPHAEGHVDNAAVGGADVSQLEGQAQEALAKVPAPELVIVQTIDNDIGCDGTDPKNVAPFGATLKQTLGTITAASPNSKILVVGQLGRPSTAFIKLLAAKVAGAQAAMTGSGICDFYDESGKLAPAGFAALSKIIDDYEAEQARVCATFANCSTDGGVRKSYVDTLANFSDDWNHLNVRGQAKEAAIAWPVVATLLGIP